MDPTYQDYIKATGDSGDLFDPEYNTRVRDWYMDWLGKNKIINTAGVSDFTRTARQLVAYNWGIGNLQKLLDKHRANGVDVDNSLDWLEGLPKETRDYVDKILLKNYSLKSKTA
jgi:membrane-bound lytic murein transglycosylase MltF